MRRKGKRPSDQDWEDAKPFFPDGYVQYNPDGRIKWRRSTCWSSFMEKQDGKCCWCGYPMAQTLPNGSTPFIQPDNYPTAEHIIRRQDGGRDHPSNLRIAHAICNKTFSDKKSASKGLCKMSTAQISKAKEVTHAN